jgi:hypothetical protein
VVEAVGVVVAGAVVVWESGGVVVDAGVVDGVDWAQATAAKASAIAVSTIALDVF